LPRGAGLARRSGVGGGANSVDRGGIAELRHEGVHTALWFVEDYRLFGYWRELAPHYDAVFTIQRGEFHDALKASGVRHIRYLPCAANPKIHRPLQLSPEETRRFGGDVSFVVRVIRTGKDFLLRSRFRPLRSGK